MDSLLILFYFFSWRGGNFWRTMGGSPRGTGPFRRRNGGGCSAKMSVLFNLKKMCYGNKNKTDTTVYSCRIVEMVFFVDGKGKV